MEYQKIANLLNNGSNKPSKFRWFISYKLIPNLNKVRK